jgi:hypothetical protein
MRTTNAQSHPLRFSVIEEHAVVGICEQDDPADGFLVTVEPSDTAGVFGLHLTEPELQTLGRAIQQRFGDQDPLVGKFAHICKDGKIEKQALVGGVVQPGYYLVTFFSWLDGEKNGSEIIKFTDMIDGEWVFYDDEERWRAVTAKEPRPARPLHA